MRFCAWRREASNVVELIQRHPRKNLDAQRNRVTAARRENSRSARQEARLAPCGQGHAVKRRRRRGGSPVVKLPQEFPLMFRGRLKGGEFLLDFFPVRCESVKVNTNGFFFGFECSFAAIPYCFYFFPDAAV
ncbi:hypothetical protein MTO96_001261 [Rhipicephalus appendiculatus]